MEYKGKGYTIERISGGYLVTDRASGAGYTCPAWYLYQWQALTGWNETRGKGALCKKLVRDLQFELKEKGSFISVDYQGGKL